MHSMMGKGTLRVWAAAAALAAGFTAAAGSGLLDRADGAVSDALYQRPSAADGQIVVVGLDQRALDALGPMPWPRSYMADAVNWLNADPELAPAVIGVDVLYAGESADPQADAALADAAAAGGNVVTAAAATFGSSLRVEDGGFYMDSRSALAWDAPFDALADAADIGHINAMADGDGVIRHALLYVDTPGGGRVCSFARAVYERWAAYCGEEPSALPETRDGFFYLPYTAAPGGYSDGVSFLDVLDGTADPAYFAGKIVLIGPYAAGLQDEYRTAIDHAAPMYGVEIQANQIDAFRAGFLPRDASRTAQLAALFFVSLLAAVWLRDRRMGQALAGWAAALAGWLALCAGLYRAGWVLHVLWLPLAVTALFIGSTAVNYILAQREKKRVTDTFGRYVDPGVLRELLAQGSPAADLGGRLFDIAVLFVDIRGFTAMSEALPPATVVEILNRYLTLTTECVMRWHGTLDKFVGDCTMAFWNAPLPQEDAAYLACCAAMDMVDGSRALGEELQARFGRTVSFGVGVHFGPAVVGNIGAPQRMDYTAIGDTVNTAARLEANAPGGTVLISRTVADALGSRARTTSLGGSVRLKGKAEGFETLTLDALERDCRRAGGN